MSHLNITKSKYKQLLPVFYLLAIIASISLLGYLFIIHNQSVNAVSTAGFKAGNIMSDAVMSSKGTLSQPQIQSFLDSKNTCKTNPQSPSVLTTVNAAKTEGTYKWGNITYKYHLNNGKFICLADQKFDGESAAQIIYKAAQDYSINPQVLLVLLQKENSLITDNWPNYNYQYATATGYGCPDSGPNNSANCNKNYFGFKNQIRNAASMFRTLLNGQGINNYPIGTNYIQYNPSSSCGGSNVYVENRATGALYTYTPYQPNKGALAAGWGEASCGAYGNRNFYLYFTEWFGDPHKTINMSGISIENQPFTDVPTTASFTLTNYTKKTMKLGDMKIAVRSPDNKNKDFDYVYDVTIPPGKTYTYKKSRKLDGTEGTYKLFIARSYGGTWHYPTFDDYGIDGDGSLTRKVTKQPTITSSLTLSPSEKNIHIGEKVTAKFTIKNNSTLPVDIGYIKPAVRDSKGAGYDFPYSPYVTLEPGKSYTYNDSRTLPAGNHRVWIANLRNGYTWSETFPTSSNTSIVRTLNVTPKPSTTLTQSLTLQRTDDHGGNSVNAQFTVRNFSTSDQVVGYIKPAVRDSKGAGYDFPYSPYITLTPGESYTYNDSRILPEGDFKIWIANLRTNQPWSDTFPANETSNLVRSSTIKVKPQAVITSPLNVSMPNKHAGNTATATFTVKNYGTTPAEIGYIKPAVRDSKNSNLDFPYSPYITLAPGESYTYNQSRALPEGNMHIWIANLRNGYDWSDVYPASETSDIRRSVDIKIKSAATLTQPLKITMDKYKAGGIATATFTVKNHGVKPVELGYIKPAGRDSKNTWSDFPYSPYITLAPGESYTYNQSQKLDNAQVYHFWIANLRNGYDWSDVYPASEATDITRVLDINLKNEARLTSSLTINTSGNTATATFTVKNYGTTPAEIGYIKPAVRDSKNSNLDFPYSPYITLAPGESYTYNKSRTLPEGNFRIWIANLRNNKPWSETYPASETSSLVRSVNISI